LAKATIDSKYKSYLESGNLHIMCVGKKGYEALSKFGLPVHPENIDLFSKVSFEQVSEFAEKVMNGFKNGEWDHVDLIFNEFKNAASQIRTINTFLPIQPSVEVSTENVSKEYIFEPNKEEILSSLIPKILKLTMFRAVLDSNASEHGQRMVSMDTATENAGQLMSLLKLKFNRERQAAITKEILEIVGAAEALAGK
jgi:F-type H+-transporting ATPase subunit gamma